MTKTPILKTSFTSVLSFGDSLSDNGFIDGHGFQRYTNTWTWVEYLAQMLGLPNENWAFGGAMSDRRNQSHPPEISWSGLAWQVEERLKAGPEGLQTALITVLCGSNDFWGGQRDGEKVAENVRLAIEALAEAGAKTLIYRESSAVLFSPGFLRGEKACFAEGWRKLVEDANLATRRDLKRHLAEKYEELDIIYLETDSFMNKIKLGETTPKFGNLDRQWLGTFEFPTPFKYLWWDEFHPMGQFHELMAEETLEALAAFLDK